MINDDGYELVNLKSSNHIAKWHSVHRLVAIHFIPNPNDYKEINHKDERQSINKRGQSNSWLNKPVLQYSLGGKFIAEYNSTTQAAKELSQTLNKDWEKIKKAINNQLRIYPNGKSYGYKWRYKL